MARVRKFFLRVIGFSAAVILLVSGAGLVAVFNNIGGLNNYLLQAVLRYTLDTSVEVRGPVEVSWSSTADGSAMLSGSVNKIRIDDPGGTSFPALFELNHAEASILVGAALSGSLVFPSVLVSGLAVNLRVIGDDATSLDLALGGNGGATNSSAGPSDDNGFILPVFGKVLFEDISLGITEEGENHSETLFLKSLALDQDSDGERSTVTVVGALAGQPLTVEGETPSLASVLESASAFPVDLSINHDFADILISGTIDPFSAEPSIDLDIDVAAYSFKEILSLFRLATPIDGVARLTASISGPTTRVAVRDLEGELVLRSGGGGRVRGAIGNLNDLEDLTLAVTMELGADPPLFDALRAGGVDPTYLSLRASVGGSATAILVDDIDLLVEEAAGADIRYEGALTVLEIMDRPRLAQSRGTARVTIPVPDLYAEKLGLELVGAGEVNATASLRLDRSETLYVENARVEAPALGGAVLSIDGTIAGIAGDFATSEPTIDLKVEGRLSNPADLLARYFPDAPPVDGVRVKFGATGSAERISIAGLGASLEAPMGTRVVLRDGRARLARPAGSLLVDEIGLAFKVDMPETEWIAKWRGLEFPELGPTVATGMLKGDLNALSVRDLKINNAEPGKHRAEIAGAVSSVGILTQPGVVGGVDLRFAVEATSNDHLGALFDQNIPFVETITAVGDVTGGLGGNAETLALSALNVDVGAGMIGTFNAKGRVEDVLDRRGVNLTLSARVDPVALAERTVPGGESEEFGHLVASALLTDDDGALGIEDLVIQSEGSRDWSVKLWGGIDDLAAQDEIALRMTAEMAKPSVVSAALGMDAIGLKATTFDGTITGNDERLSVNGAFVVGETRFEGELLGDISGRIPKLKGKLFSRYLNISDFVADPAKPSEIAPESAEQAERQPADRLVFGEDPLPFDLLNKADIEIDLAVDEVVGSTVALDRIAASAELRSGRLVIDPIVLDLVGGRINSVIRMDASGPVPTVSVRARADNLDVATGFRVADTEPPIAGQLDAILNVGANGQSPRSLARTLDGRFEAVMVNGRIQTSAFDLMGLDIFSWMLSRSASRGFTEADCLLIRLDSEDGKATLTNFILDTEGLRTGGTGQINLAEETISLIFNPEPKNTVVAKFGTPVEITGSLADPKVDLNAINLATDMLARIALSPVQVLESLLPSVGGGDPEQNHPCAKK